MTREAARFFSVILSAAKDLARQRVWADAGREGVRRDSSPQRLRMTGTGAGFRERYFGDVQMILSRG